MDLSIFPLEIENMIQDYVQQLWLMDHKKKFTRTLKTIETISRECYPLENSPTCVQWFMKIPFVSEKNDDIEFTNKFCLLLHNHKSWTLFNEQGTIFYKRHLTYQVRDPTYQVRDPVSFF